MRAWLLLLVLPVAACSGELDATDDAEPDTSLFRDFSREGNGKFDQAGHPTNAVVSEAEAVCDGAGQRLARSFLARSGEACRTELRPRSFGELTLSVKLRAIPARRGDVVTLTIRDDQGALLGERTLTSAQVRRANAWTHVALPFAMTQGERAHLTITGAGNGRLELDYLELFASRFGLLIDPGSREYAATDELIFETARDATTLTLTVDGIDRSAKLQQLLRSGVAHTELTSYRRLVRVRAGALLGPLGSAMDLVVHAGGEVARIEVRRAPPPCEFVGDLEGKKVLLTGFQPFPADADHDNVSWVAVDALDPLAVPGAQLMRLQLPVEYDRAAAEVASAIERCQPDLVIAFGQGGGDLHLEQTAYNLKDTAELSGGVPDNRGVVFAGEPIDASAEETRATTLPLPSITAALAALGEPAQPSDDPGRYVCNNVFFVLAGAAATRGVPAGFVHLPYETQFPEATRARWGRVVETIVSSSLR